MNKSQIKQCQNCQNPFVVEPDDFAFYEKINVPPPTFCPECRMIRRMVFRNERTLYKRKCDLCKKENFSIYGNHTPYIMYCDKCWWSDNWDSMKYGQEYDFSKSFFEQMNELWQIVPAIGLMNDSPEKLVNIEYCNSSWDAKNCYKCVTVGISENCFYSNAIVYAKDIFDSTWTVRSEKCYQCIDCYNSYNVSFCQNIDNCMDSLFLFNCRNCSNCFGCAGLRHKKYYIFNQPYSKENYAKKLEEFNLSSFSNLTKIANKFKKHKLNFPYKHSFLTNCINVSGNNVRNSKNCIKCFDIEGNVENSKYTSYAGLGLKDCYDGFDVGTNSEIFYECIGAGQNCYNIIFSHWSWKNSSDLKYCSNCINSHHLFACVGLRNKQYCILNKQYAKEQYEELVPKIIKHMNDMPYTDKKGRVYRYGEFFPMELSPFAYNETVAQEYFPLTKEQAVEQGYQWKEPETKDYKITMKIEQIPDHIKDIKDDIVDQIIQCIHYDIDKKQTICNEQCSTAFRIILRELEFYRKQNLPIPRLCPNCRHYQRVKQRNPLKLWHRQCQCAGTQSDNKVYQNTAEHNHHDKQHCSNEFETTYAPERPEIVYCEKCYQQEVV